MPLVQEVHAPLISLYISHVFMNSHRKAWMNTVWYMFHTMLLLFKRIPVSRECKFTNIERENHQHFKFQCKYTEKKKRDRKKCVAWNGSERTSQNNKTCIIHYMNSWMKCVCVFFLSWGDEEISYAWKCLLNEEENQN